MTPASLIDLYLDRGTPMRQLSLCLASKTPAFRLAWLMFDVEYRASEFAREHCENCPDCNLEKAS